MTNKKNRLNKLQHIYTIDDYTVVKIILYKTCFHKMDYYTTVKMNDRELQESTWINLRHMNCVKKVPEKEHIFILIEYIVYIKYHYI